jgi:hypothetical protein
MISGRLDSGSPAQSGTDAGTARQQRRRCVRGDDVLSWDRSSGEVLAVVTSCTVGATRLRTWLPGHVPWQAWLHRLPVVLLADKRVQ